MNSGVSSSRAGRFFTAVTHCPRLVLFVSLVTLAVFASALPRLTRDSSNMANIHPEHPARVATDRVREIFGLTDDGSMALVIVDEAPGGVFDPETLALVHWLTDEVSRLRGVDPEGVKSLSTEKDIVGSDWGMEVRPFFDAAPETVSQARAIREAVLDFDLYVDALAARDGRATAIVAELLPGADDNAVYWMLMELAARAPTRGEQIHVAGIGAFNARIGEYVEADAQRLNPIAALVILLMLGVAYRTVRGVALPALAMVGAVVAAVGSMALLEVPFYTLTNSVTVILIAIGVCDGIHIMGQYYAEQARTPFASGRELAIRTMVEMWRPVTITSLTTIAGFLAISATTDVPPMQWYGVFATIGVLAALALSVFTIPAALSILPPRASPAFRPGSEESDVFSRGTAGLGRLVSARPEVSLVLAGGLIVLAVWGASRLEIDNSATNYLHEQEPLHIAIDETNRTLGGTWNLDILVETAEPDGLYRPEALRRLDELQHYLEALPHVKSSRSIVEYIKQMNRAMNADDPAHYSIPDDADLIAQYFLAYSASASPTDFEEVVDYEFRRANVRVALDVERSTASSAVVTAVQRFLEEEFDPGELRLSLAGWAFLGHHWRQDIARSQWLGLPGALLAVGAVSAVCFRSVVAGGLSIVPALLAVLFAYAVMGLRGIWMDFANSVLAALAVGVTADFAVHTLDRMVELTRKRGVSLERALEELFPTTGRALLFNFAAVTLGFGVLVSSHIPPLSKFGILVVVCVSASALVSVTVLPALVRVAKPRFLGLRARRPTPQAAVKAAALVLALSVGMPPRAHAELAPLPPGEEVARQINAREDGESLSQRVRMELIDRRGQRRVRETRSYRRTYDGERRSLLFFESPRNVRGTGILTFDYAEPKRDDDQWLYLPAARKVRRIAGSDRGRYFLGTDFTYDDVKNAGRVSLGEYRWRTLREELLDGRPCLVLEAIPISDAVARELGYGRVLRWVDRELWIVHKFEAWDPNGNPLKTALFSEFREVDGIWTAHRLEAQNHKTRHRSVFTVYDVDYGAAVPDEVFTRRSLQRGR